MTNPMALPHNDPPTPTGWEAVWMFPTTPLSWLKSIDLPVDEEGIHL